MTQNSVVVIDGSNIATEGRSLPSLAQLDEAVRSFLEEYPHDQFIVVVDATFEHRIDPSERQVYDEALAANELLTPPAGTIGRGDAFILAIAEKAGATVFSNDSFQEFHGDFEWLFDEGRLIGGKPVPFIGWVFTARTPVRGQKSRQATRSAVRKRVRGGETASAKSALRSVPRRSATSPTANLPMPVPKSPPPGPVRSRRSEGSADGPPEERPGAPERSRPDDTDRPPRRGGRRRSGASPLEPVNEGLAFVTFISEHAVGEDVEGEVTEFSSHGAYVSVGDARCYVPLSFLGDPPPRAARDVLERGETHTFVVQAIDGPRRAIDLALPGFERLDGVTDRAEGIDEDDEAPAARRSRLAVDERTADQDDEAPVRRSRKRATAPPVAEVVAELTEGPADEPVVRRRTRKSPARTRGAVDESALVEQEPDIVEDEGREDVERVVRRRPRKAAPAAAEATAGASIAEEQEVLPRRRTRKAAATVTEPVPSARGSSDPGPQEAPPARRRGGARTVPDPTEVAPRGAGTIGDGAVGEPQAPSGKPVLSPAPGIGGTGDVPAARRRPRAPRVADPVAADGAATAVVDEPAPRRRTRVRPAAEPAPAPAAVPVAEGATTRRRTRARPDDETAAPAPAAAKVGVEPAGAAPPRGRGRRVAVPDPGAPTSGPEATTASAAVESGPVVQVEGGPAEGAPAAKRTGARRSATKATGSATAAPVKVPVKRAVTKRAAADDGDGGVPTTNAPAKRSGAIDPGAPDASAAPAKRAPAKRAAKKASTKVDTGEPAPVKAAPKRSPARTKAPDGA